MCNVTVYRRYEKPQQGFKVLLSARKTTVFTKTCNAPFLTVGLFLFPPLLNFFFSFSVSPLFISFLYLLILFRLNGGQDRSTEQRPFRHCSRKRIVLFYTFEISWFFQNSLLRCRILHRIESYTRRNSIYPLKDKLFFKVQSVIMLAR